MGKAEQVNTVHLDTHVLVWLYIPRLDLLSSRATEILGESGNSKLAVSPMAILELTYLKEIGRLTVDGPTLVRNLCNVIGLETDTASLGEIVDIANGLEWTRDPFDRLIVANAIVTRATLLTGDRSILENFSHAIW